MKASIIIPISSAALLLCAVMAAAAQNSPSAIDPKGCAPSERLQTDGKATDPKMPEAKAGEPLSDKLARTDGVICPPNVDQGMKATTPNTGKMPVIPPPGSPGGNPDVQPK